MRSKIKEKGITISSKHMHSKDKTFILWETAEALAASSNVNFVLTNLSSKHRTIKFKIHGDDENTSSFMESFKLLMDLGTFSGHKIIIGEYEKI